MPAQALTLDPGDRPDRRFLAALTTKIEPVRLPLTYKAALAVVAFAMVLLPLLYVALVGLAAWGVAWWAIHGVRLLAGVGLLKIRLLLFITPLVAGGTAVLFLVKPLFARRPRAAEAAPLDPADEPLLFDFVRRTALAVGAPVPREIRLDSEVNASAALRRGLFSLFADDLVLTLGVPLVAGLTLEQLAGVLAHELGHFGQRAGMRLSYIVFSVNHWFVRVVYERDGFDVQLQETIEEGRDWRVQLIARLASFFVWIGRAILKGLMFAGYAISGSLSRQMEFDADCYTVRLVGRRVHSSILCDLFMLSQVHGICLSAVPEQLERRRLPDSLAALMGTQRQRFAKPLAAAYKEHLAAGRTGLFDTHPTLRERIARSLSGPAQGIFACDLPAAALFRDFAARERAISRDIFQSLLGQPLPDDALVPAEEVVDELAEIDREVEAVERYWPGGVSPVHPLPLPATLPPTPADPAALAAAAAAVEAERESAAALLGRYRDLFNQRLAALRAQALVSYGVPIYAADYGLQRADQESVREILAATAAQLAALDEQLAPLQSNLAGRLTAALSFLGAPELVARLADGAAWQRQAPSLLATAACLREVVPLVIELEQTRVLLGTVGSRMYRAKTLAAPLAELAQRGHAQLCQILSLLEGATDPFSEDAVALARLVAPKGLPPVEPGPVVHAMTAAHDLLDLYGRVSLRLCRIAAVLEEAAARPRFAFSSATS